MLCVAALAMVALPVRVTLGTTGELGDADGDAKHPAYRQIERLTEVMLLIRKHYVEEKTYEDIMRGALRGMMKTIDTYSSFLDPSDYTDMRTETAGKYSGIGVHIGMKGDALTVIAPIEDGPGFRAGLQSGDRIIEIDGEKTGGVTLQEAVEKLRGPAGEEVTVKILRIGEGTARDVELTREEITVSSVKGERIVEDGIAYIRITHFSAPTSEFLEKALGRLRDKGMTALVLDLRSNPGGLLRSAVDVSGRFLKEGTLVVATKGRSGIENELKVQRAAGDAFRDIPLAVLVNSGSASASEIVAGALQDHGRAVVVGDTTFGKGSVQSVIQLKSDGESAVRLTTACYYTPAGREIHENGIEPDVRVYLTPSEWRRVQVKRAHIESPNYFSDEARKEYADVVDSQLERAVDVLHAVRVFRSAEAK